MAKKINLDRFKGEIKELYYEKDLSLKKMAKKLGVSPTLIRLNMVLWNFKRRPSLKRDRINPPAKEELEKYYINDKLSMDKIAKILNVDPTTICKWINDYSISVRKFKYKKFDFSGNPYEKAYIRGLAWGDFHTKKHCRQIQIEVSSSHPAMIELFYSLFEKYTTPNKYLKFNKITRRSEWKAWAFLNNSFEFLLSKNYNIDNEYFYDFLTGFFDAEGTLHIYNNHDYIGLSLLIYNFDKKLLEIFRQGLEKDGFHPKLSLFSKKGTKNSDNYYQSEDLFALRLHTNKEVLSLLSKMPIKHRERIERFKIASFAQKFKKWSEIAEYVDELKIQIKNEVKNFIDPMNIQNEKSPILPRIEK